MRGIAHMCVSIVLLMALVCTGMAVQPSRMHLPEDVRKEYRNPDGSCVQCSIGMCGAHSGVLAAAYLLEEFDGQPAERGGSWPARVTEYCNRRGIEAFNVTSRDPKQTIEWAKWACATGRFAAIGLDRMHFQTVYGYEPGAERPWMVCNNNSTHRIDRYTEAEFLARHKACGPWIVILKQPAPDPPVLAEWWR